MALLSRTRTKAAPPQRAMIASAVLVKQSQLRAVPEQRDWQTRAWEYYDVCGELRFAAQWFSNALARCRLYVGLPDEDGAGDPEPIAEGDDDTPGRGDLNARVPLDELFHGQHADMLARLAIHLTVPGESYLVGLDMPAKEDQPAERRWIVASGEEFRKQNRKVKVRLPDSNEEVEVDLENSTVIRLWRPHARKAWEADSPVRALLPVLKELLDLSSHITASVESRLAGAGILWMPEDATLPAPATQPGGKPLHEDPGMATLIDAMVTPITDRDSASAVVPILGRLPAATQGKTPAKPEFMTFATPLDAKVQELREAAIRRLASGLDMPPEVLLGLGDINHWTSWQLEESAIKLHIEPLLGLICQALTERYLRPALTALGVANPDQYVIWFDASELALRPNRSPEAQALHALGLLKNAAVLRESGFGDDDAPDDNEWMKWLMVELAKANTDPLNVAPYLAKLGIELDLTKMIEAKQATAAKPPTPGADEEPPPGREGGNGGAGGGAGRPDIPATPGAPGTTPPSGTPVPAAAALAAAGTGEDVPRALVSAALLAHYPLKAVEMGVMQALEKAGKKLLSWGGRKYRNRLDCPAWELHVRLPACDFDLDQLLDGAYGCLEEVLGDQPCVKATVDSYVRDLLTNQRRHTRAALYDALRGAGCLYSGDDNTDGYGARHAA